MRRASDGDAIRSKTRRPVKHPARRAQALTPRRLRLQDQSRASRWRNDSRGAHRRARSAPCRGAGVRTVLHHGVPLPLERDRHHRSLVFVRRDLKLRREPRVGQLKPAVIGRPETRRARVNRHVPARRRGLVGTWVIAGPTRYAISTADPRFGDDRSFKTVRDVQDAAAPPPPNLRAGGAVNEHQGNSESGWASRRGAPCYSRR